MSTDSKKYKVSILYYDGETEIVEFMTTDLEWTIEQYARNREPFKWKILK